MKQQKMYKYNKPAVEEGKKAPFILCYANNEAHALQVLRERFRKEDGTYEFIDKSLIEEYVPKNDPKKVKGKGKKKTTSKK